MTNINYNLLSPCPLCDLPLFLRPEKGVEERPDGLLQHRDGWCLEPARPTGRRGLHAVLDAADRSNGLPPLA